MLCDEVVSWGFLLRPVPGRVRRRGGAGRGHAEVPRREGQSSLVRFQVPVTRVFSLHVVQAGSAGVAAGCGRACPDSVQPSW